MRGGAGRGRVAVRGGALKGGACERERRDRCKGAEMKDRRGLGRHAHLVEFPELVPQLPAALAQGLALQAAKA